MANMDFNNLLIQTHWSDFESYGEIIRDPDISIANKAKRYFDTIVLVCGDTPENRVVRKYAEEMGVECFQGDLWDVSKRFNACMKKYGMIYAARILNYHFMVDCAFLVKCLEILRSEKRDYLVLPRNFDMKFAGDIFSLSFLNKAEALSTRECPEKAFTSRSLSFCPWAAVDLFPEFFQLSCLESVPVYGLEKFKAIRDVVNRYYPERARLNDMPAYKVALSLLESNRGIVADIACGHGDGAAKLSRFNELVFGIDYSRKQILENQRRFSEVNNLIFFSCDASDVKILQENSLDAVVSIHSMEHFRDDVRFLTNCSKWLKKGGQMVLEVPLSMKYPFTDIGRPLGDKHIREYEIKQLYAKCESYFKIENIFGVSRGNYIAPEKARNAVMLLLRKKI